MFAAHRLLFMLGLALAPWVGAQSADGPVVYRTREDAALGLAHSSSFQRLSPAGRQAFLGGLRFWDGGLRGLDALPLTMELSKPDIEALLDALGLSDWKAQPFVQAAPLAVDPDIRSTHEMLSVLYAMQADFSRVREAGAVKTGRWHQQELPRRIQPWLRQPLAALRDGELNVLHRAYGMAVFAEPTAQETLMLGQLLAEKQGRKLASDADIRSLHKGYRTARLFAEARQLAARYPALDLPEVEEITDMTPHGHAGLTVLQMTSAGRLQRMPLDLGEGPRLVAVLHPFCRFSAHFTHALTNDPSLAARLKPLKPLFLIAQREDLRLQAIQEWNQAHPEWPYWGSWQDEEWLARGVDLSGTPHFFLLFCGEVVAKLIGWPLDGSHRAKLLELLEKTASQPGAR